MLSRLPEKLNAERERSVDSVVSELAQERAVSLGKAANKLETSLLSLRQAYTETAVRVAANALWEMVVQREAAGVRCDLNEIARDYQVPREVVARMSPYRSG